MPEQPPEWMQFGHVGGFPYLIQGGGGRLFRFHLRFAVVDARSERAAKLIQTAFRNKS